MKEIGIGLLGFGTIGAGVVEGLHNNENIITERLGVRLVLQGVADLDVTSDRGVSVDSALLTTDAKSVVNNPAVDIVVELIGGTGIAKELVMEALALGKGVVTANKALLAKHGDEIFGLAREKGVDIYFGASVGGGIPIIRALREGLVANRVKSILGILNGTCNYILTKMETEGLSFDSVLKEAQDKGYAEADPALDIDGGDTAHKAAILAGLAYGGIPSLDKIHVEGIRNLKKADLDYALELGYRIKLLAVIRSGDDQVEVRIHPALLPLKHVLASVSGVYNAVMVDSDLAGNTLYYGQGAGRKPTASTVLGDVADIARNIASDSKHRLPALASASQDFALKPMDDIKTCYYLRVTLAEQSVHLEKITAVFDAKSISTASVVQKEAENGNESSVIIVTEKANERDVIDAIRNIEQLDFVKSKTVKLRIEE